MPFVKWRRRIEGQLRDKIQQPNPVGDGTLKINDLRPGTTVSVDHFESRLKGRTFDSFGKATSDQYIGGCIFFITPVVMFISNFNWVFQPLKQFEPNKTLKDMPSTME